MRNESFHNNTGDGQIADRDYATDAVDVTRPLHPHECPRCHYLGCHFGERGARYDLYLCDWPDGPDLITRFGAEPKDWVCVELKYAAGRTGAYHYDAAVTRAHELASPNSLLAAMKAAMDECDRLVAAHDAGGAREPAVRASERERACFLAVYRRIRDLTEAGCAVYLYGRWSTGDPLPVRSLGSDRNRSSIHFDEDPGADFFPRVCNLRVVELIKVVDEEPVRRALGHPWVASRIEARLAGIADDEELRTAARADLVDFFTAAARSAMLVPLPSSPAPPDATAVHDLFATAGRARWLDEEVPHLMFGVLPLREPRLRPHAAAVREARYHLAQLAHFLVTLARLHPGELPADDHLQRGPWLRLAELALLPRPASYEHAT